MKKYLKYIIAIAVIAALLIIFRDYLTAEQMSAFMQSVRTHPLAPIIFIGIYAVSVTLIVPATALTLLSGPLFGFWWGVVYTTIGANIGCHLSYFIAKALGRDVVTKFVKSGSFLDNAQKSAQKNGFEFMMYARLIPLFPFAAVNYLSGIIGIKYKHYTIATLIGMIPGSAVYVYLGYSASNVKDNPWGLILSIAVLILFTVIMMLVKKKGQNKYDKAKTTT